MWQRKWFFWMESLQITAGERRVILGLICMYLVVTGFQLFGPERSIYDESYYEPVIAEFHRLAGLKNQDRAVLLARYYPKEDPEQSRDHGQIASLDKKPKPAQAEDSLLVNIQTAGLDELVRLSGIGPVTAGKIMDYRKKNGPFEEPEDLLNVSGIGPVTLSKIRMFITLSRDDPDTDRNQVTETDRKNNPGQLMKTDPDSISAPYTGPDQ
ncbi:MAG: helix-hairpin-helix domain-containing protein [Cyclonatronaceae bacterium]